MRKTNGLWLAAAATTGLLAAHCGSSSDEGGSPFVDASHVDAPVQLS